MPDWPISPRGIGMQAKLYSLSTSHPAMAAAGMLEHKGIEFRTVDLLPGMHPLLVRAAGFRGGTVPALRLDGRRIQGSLEISRALEQVVPDPSLFPADAPARREVEDAERWGEEVLQTVVRRLFRWAARNSQRVRTWIAGDVVGMPAPALMGYLNAPVALVMARLVSADDDTARAELARLPEVLDHVDTLIERGTIGAKAPNAADFQVLSSVRVLLAFEDLKGHFAGRPCAAAATNLFPRYPGDVPAALPREWLPA
jgi:glutathione S-transferase